jgi:signal transduction histidine kinase
LYPIKNSNGEVVNVVFIEEDITDRKQAEREILRYHERLKALASQLTVTEEKERRRIAVDLHDHVGQSLALARMQIDSAKKSAADDRLAARLDEISENLRKAIHDTRHLIFDLSPPAMHQIGLGAAVSEWLEEQIEKRYGIKTEFFDNIEQRYRKTLDDNVRAILFRNVRELLINMVKHAQANQVSVSMEITDGALKTVIQDNGIGFDQSSEIQNVKSEEGFGLFSIKERMADLGGALKIESQPGKGCKAVLTVPLSIDDDKEIL